MKALYVNPLLFILIGLGAGGPAAATPWSKRKYELVETVLTPIKLGAATKVAFGAIQASCSDGNNIYICDMRSVAKIETEFSLQLSQHTHLKGYRNNVAIAVNDLHVYVATETAKGGKAALVRLHRSSLKFESAIILAQNSVVFSLTLDANNLYCGTYSFPGMILKVDVSHGPRKGARAMHARCHVKSHCFANS
jgi:hypothetical protein